MIEHHACEAIHLHDAYATGRGLEPDPVQPVGFHPQGLRNQLHRDTQSSDTRELQDQEDLLLRQTVLRGGTPRRVQTLPPNPEKTNVTQPFKTL